MDFIIDDWKKTMQDFNDCIEKSLDEIRSCKAAVQAITPEYVNQKRPGKYIRDDNRIVLSAPEIVIGNLDKDGHLWAGAGSTVVIRSNDISIEATSGMPGCGGVITNRASSIRSIAVDPGIDGLENVVGEVSEIISHGRSVCISSNDEIGAFSSPAAANAGVTIHSDTALVLDASKSVAGKKKSLDSGISALKNHKAEQKQNVGALKSRLDELLKRMQKILKDNDERSDDLDDLRSSVGSIDDMRMDFERVSVVLSSVLKEYTESLSALAETCRVINSLEAQKNGLPDESKFKEKPTGASISLNGEKISLVSKDGDGNVRTSYGSGVSVQACNVSISSKDNDNALLKNGRIGLSAKDIEISTANTKFKDLSKLDEADITAEGNVRILSKKVAMGAVDYEYKAKKVTEKSLVKGGKLDIRFESIGLSATETAGAAAGSVKINAKDIEIKSFDVKKDDRSDDKIAAGSSLLLTSEKVFAGSRDKNNKTKQIQIVADKTGVFGDTTAEVQQGEAKAILQLDGGNVSVSGGKTSLYGATEVNGKTDFKADVTAPKASIKNVEASTSFKSPNIQDGFAAPAPPSSAKLSAKLKFEEKKAAEGGKK